jgi:transposase
MVELRDIIQRLRLGYSVRAIHRETGRHRTVIRAARNLANREGWLRLTNELPGEEEIARTHKQTFIASHVVPHPLEPYEEQIKDWLQAKYNFQVIHKLLDAQGIKLSESTVRRWIHRRSVSLATRTQLRPPAPLESMQVGCLYTLLVAGNKSRKRQVILMTFLDDATHRVLYASIDFIQNSLAFECGIKHILKAHGMIGRLYVNAVMSLVSAQTQRILDTLGIILMDSRVGKPGGFVKVERLHRKIREEFLRPLDTQVPRSLENLDSRLHIWLDSEYHRSPQQGLEGKTPLEAWVENAAFIIPVPSGVDPDRLFVHETRYVAYGDSKCQ